MSEETVVRQAAPTLAGVKTGSLFPYRCQSCAACVRQLVERFHREGEFPHEIGLFLSYPPEDVKGFIADRDNYKAQCMWKIYGDEEKARTLCAKFQRCTECYCRLWQKGRRLEQLAVAG